MSYPAGSMGDVTEDVLARFGAATRAWFADAFAEPTAAQAGAWAAIAAGQHALVVAPTGSGKTLAAFLWSLDRLAAEAAPADPQRRCRVLYVSPLKALAVDVERNLRAPLTGIRHAAARLGHCPAGHHRGHAHRRHPRRRAAGLRPDPAGHPDHHPGVAVPAAHLGRARVAARRGDSDRRRGARGRRDQARRAPGAVPGAAGRAAAQARPSGSACPPRSGRSTRPRASSAAPARWRSCSRRPPRPSRSASRCRWRT